MNVLYLDHFNRHGGAQEYILDLADWMAGHGVNAFINDFDIESLRAPGRRFVHTGFALLGKNYRKPSFHLRAVRNHFQVRALAERERIDIVHANSLPALALARSARGRPIVFTCHDCLESKLKNKLIAAIPDLIIAVSETVKSHLESKGVKKPIVVIFNGFPDHGDGASATAADAVAATGPRIVSTPKTSIKGEVTLGLVARLVPWKGCDLFIEAARRLAAERPQARFQLIGSFEDETYREKILASLAGTPITHVPFRQGKGAIYESLDVVVNASIDPEPFGRTLVEAGMFRRASVGPDSGGPAEIIVNGFSGLTFATGSADSLAAALRALIDSPALRAKLGDGARRRFLDTFTLDAIGAQVKARYDAFASIT
jgi:glycosyltransferase involved in cell wall biosynthesis